MGLQASTNFRERILGSESFANIFDGGRILLYTGTQPVDADHAPLTPPIAEITNSGIAWTPGGGSAGLLFEQFGVWIAKDSTQTWKLKATAAGVIGWFRLQGPDDDNQSLSYSYPRIDGAVLSTPGAELTLVNTTVAADNVRDVHQFLYTLLPITGA